MNHKPIAPPPGGAIVSKLEGGMASEWSFWFQLLYGALADIKAYEIEYDVISVPAQSTSEQAIPVTGVTLGDMVFVTPQSSSGVGIGYAFVSGADEVTVAFMNPTTGAIDPGVVMFDVMTVAR